MNQTLSWKQRWLFDRFTTTTVAAVATMAVTTVALTACGEAKSGGDPTEAAASEPAPWRFAAGEKARCDEPGVKERIARAKALQTETDENGTLSPPDEVMEMTGSTESYEAQIAVWNKLSAADRIHQLCLAVDLGDDRS